jgi:hypothetical protein
MRYNPGSKKSLMQMEFPRMASLANAAADGKVRVWQRR